MYLLPTAEQQELMQTASDFLSKELSTRLIRDRRAEAAAVPPKTWQTCGDLGLLALGLPEDKGGVGAGLADEALVFRAIGRVPAPGPFLSSTLGARVAAFSGDEERAHAVIYGDLPVGLMLLSRGTSLSAAGVTGDVALLDVADGGLALVMTAELAALVDTSGLSHVRHLPGVDPAVRLSSARADALPLLCSVPADIDPVWLRATILTAALLSGIAEGCRDASVTHAKVREQFGRPIGVHQAIKHRCADMAVLAEATGSQTSFAAAAVDGGRPDSEFQALSALVMAAHAARENATANIQVHGGMGFTFEHDAHLYLKRAEVLSHVLDSRPAHLARLLSLPRPAA